jgi:outer membrane protein assembly factor BamA
MRNGNPITDRAYRDDALGGRAYYLGRAELEIPLGSAPSELGLRPSVFVDVGACSACAAAADRSTSASFELDRRS